MRNEYITNALFVMVNNFAEKFGGNTLVKKYSEILNPPPEEARSEEEVISSLQNKMKAFK